MDDSVKKAVKSKRVRDTANWDDSVTHLFCDLCIKEIERGNRPTTHLTKDGWDHVKEAFNAETGRKYDRLKFKNKWDQLKKDWKLWKELKRGATGLGWDASRRTILAPDDWWKAKLEAIPTARKFRSSGIEPHLEDKLEMMFFDVTANGEDTHNPTNPRMSRPTEEVQSVSEGSNDNVPREVPSSSHSKHARFEQRKRPKASFVRDSISQLVQAFSSAAPPPQPPPPAPAESQEIAVLINALDAIPEVAKDPEMYASCLKLFENPRRSQLFLQAPAHMRLRYLLLALSD